LSRVRRIKLNIPDSRPSIFNRMAR
jgi:hypothetical protein